MTRIAVVTQDDPFYMPLFFETLFENLEESVEIEFLVLFQPFGEGTLALARRMYEFYGPLNFLKRGVQYAVRTVLNATGIRTYSVERLARQHGVPVEHRTTVNDESFVDRLHDVDILLSAASPEIFDPEVLDAPTRGCLNVHTAALPKYRGMMPTFWALYHGDNEVGVTIHTMTEEIDKGRAVRRGAFPVAPEDTLDDVIKRGKRLGGELTAAALADVANDSVSLEPITGEESYFSFPSAADRRQLQQQGRELL
jgi:methionyl-tRNA formyltransferase